MKLKGKILKKLSKKDIAKKEKTLKVMTELREKDSERLRGILSSKLTWLREEKMKAYNVMKGLAKQIELLKEQTLKQEGAIILIQEVLTDGRGKKEDKEKK